MQKHLKLPPLLLVMWKLLSIAIQFFKFMHFVKKD